MTPAMLRFRATYTALADALGRAPALCEVADALNVRCASAERTRDKLRLAGVALAFSFAAGKGKEGGRRIVRVTLAAGGRP